MNKARTLDGRYKKDLPPVKKVSRLLRRTPGMVNPEAHSPSYRPPRWRR